MKASDDFVFIERHRPFHTTQDYLFEIDEYRRHDGSQFLLAHIRVFKLSLSTLKQMTHEWKILRQCVTAPLFAVPEVADDKWKSFVELFGFRPFMDAVPCENGDVRPMYIHTV